MSVEHLSNLGHVGVLNPKAFIPVARRNDETIIGGHYETLMTLLDPFIEIVAQMTTVEIHIGH